MNSTERREIALSILSGCRIKSPHRQFVGAKKVIPFHNDRKHVNGKVWSQCKKKKCYESRRMAERIALQVSRLRGDKIRAYECPFCNQWHLTRKTDRYASKK